MSVNDVLAGVRVLEVAAWTFVPSAGAVLAEWGAEVIKVEPRDGGDPQRGLVSMGLVPAGAGGVNYMIEMPNRGKKSIGVDLRNPDGQQVVHELAKTCDVFLTSYLPSRRTSFAIDVADIRAANPDIVYVRGSGYGPLGEDRDRPGFDGVSYWARGGIGMALTGPDSDLVLPRAAFGDLLGGMTIAGGIAAALYKRKATGQTSIVDVSLLALAAYNITPDITTSYLYADDPIPTFGHADAPNPLAGNYRTQDGRYVNLMMLQADRFYAEFMTLIGLTDLIDDVRFSDGAARFANRVELIALLDDVFAAKTLSEWRAVLAPLSGAWGPVQSPSELPEDAAVVANGYIPTMTTMSGAPYRMPVNPVQFDEEHVVPDGAPEHGQHTEEVLLEAGIDWERIEHYKSTGAIL
ncbi:CaiB/BaiF CoA-transferase family protein [Mycobacterium sp. EPa45]|uniref:CaiB/BaiF CoA transferase family protein n=1 Tax=Mycobacterium sp. EPa45 TaxID=1545728 RepID=UPI000641C0C5|nr:CoA transferase [Mycobacterium sp. EPa45]AKK25493.1 CoA-transferase [Mycobacterium sp. EPa45]